MFKMILSFLMIIMSIYMFFLNHPLSMGLMILLQTLLMCLMSGMMMKTYWFSYILFLVFLGGLLVLFIYVSSIASNEMFKIKNKFIIYLSFLIIMFCMYMYMYMTKFNWLNYNSNFYDMNKFFDLNLFMNNENKINLIKLYNNQSFYLMIMMIIYLFITLIAVVKITNIFFGPLRSSSF